MDSVLNLKNEPAVYCINNTNKDIVYIGGSSAVANRLSRHIFNLKNDSHEKLAMQLDYNECGGVGFYFHVLEWCEEVDFFEREKHFINECKSKMYNSYTFDNKLVKEANFIRKKELGYFEELEYLKNLFVFINSKEEFYEAVGKKIGRSALYVRHNRFKKDFNIPEGELKDTICVAKKAVKNQIIQQQKALQANDV